jgi:hypothetical protein
VDVGIPTPMGKRKAPIFVWGPEAESWIADAVESRADPEIEQFSAWPAWIVIWRDPSHSTYLLILANDLDPQPTDILAWGDRAESSLAAVEAALDLDELWD